MPQQETIQIALATLNLVSFALFGIDKALARATRQNRISEQSLLIVAAVFASVGALFGMVLFNHKVGKGNFRFGVPVLVLIHVLILSWLGYI